MTEETLSSTANFLYYLSHQYSLKLNSEQADNIELLLRIDKQSLRRLLYRFEDQVMKRKAVESQSRLKEDKIDFVTGIADAAKKFKSIFEDGDKTASFGNSFDQSESSLDEFLRQYRTPNASQADLTTSISSGDADKLSPVSTQPTSESSQNSALQKSTGVIKDGFGIEHNHHRLWKQLNYGVKFMLAMVMNSDPLLDTFNLFPDGLKSLCNIGTREAMQQWLCSPDPDLRQTASTFMSLPFLEACMDLDKEEAMIKGGCKYLHLEQEGWCGGRVNFAGKISLSQQGQIQLRLRPFSLKTSCRFTRRFGSSRFLRLDVPKIYESEAQKKEVFDYLNSPIHILDHRFDLLCIKEKDSKEKSSAGWTAILFELGEDIPSIWHFYEWHGPWKENSNGKLQKYMQRIHLGLSKSIPGPFIPKDSVRRIDDIISKSGEVMTDGAAPISRGALIKIAISLGSTSIPTAVQGRYDGAKGMWYLDSTSKADEIWIGIRPSQTKLHRAVTTEKCHQVFDVLQTSNVTTPSSLSLQILLVLTHNGVGQQVLLKMQKEQLQEVVDNLLGKGDTKKEGLELAKSLDEAMSVYFTRAKRAAGHLALARGLSSRAAEELEYNVAEEEGEDEDLDNRSTEYQTVSERAYDMLLAGFERDESQPLMDLIVKVTKTFIDRTVKDFHLCVWRSAEAFVIPDPFGVLKEGEVHFKFGANAPIDPVTMMRVTHLVDEVLVTRHPCLTPADIQKVTAVLHPALAEYTDVVIFSTQGKRPLASMLSGGDYDGDTVRVIWDEILVKSFKNADFDQQQPSISIEDVFHENKDKVEILLKAQDKNEHLSTLITTPLRSSGSKGQYGHWQKVAAYTKGCASQEAIDLAFKFNNSMDGVKTGLTIKEEVLRQDRRLYNLTLPKWANKEKKPNCKLGLPPRNAPPDALRDKRLGRSIIDALYQLGLQEGGRLKGELEAKQQAQGLKRDVDIAHCWEEAIRMNTLNPLQVDVMTEHCRSVLKMHQEARCQYAVKKDEKRTGSVSPSKLKRTASIKNGSLLVCDLPVASLSFGQIPLLYKNWIYDHVKAFEMAGLEPHKDRKAKITDVLDAGQMNRLDDLLISCLYIQACKSRYTEKIAFDIAGQELLNLKVVERKKRLENDAVSFKYRQSIISLPKSTAHALRLGKIL